MSRLPLALPLVLVFALPATAVDPKELKPGLVATYTESTEGNPGVVVTRLEPSVGITLDMKEVPHPRMKRVGQIAWKGYINVVTPGKYRFEVEVLGGSFKVKVADKDVIDGTPAFDSTMTTADQVELAPGAWPFETTVYAYGNRPIRLKVSWAGPGFRTEPIPYFFFGHRPKDRPASFAKDVQLEYGRFLFEELACAKCHTPAAADAMAKTLADRTGPDLSEIGKRVYPGWLDAWLADPQKVRPHAQMPRMFSDDDQGKAERYAVVQYLVSLGGPLPEPRPGPILSNEYRRSVTRGEALFTTTGCAACHGKQLAGTAKRSDDDEDAKPPAFDPADSAYGLGTSTGSQWLYPLGALGSKTRAEELAKYLQDPLKTNPHGRMPNMQLNAQDALDIARHLCRVTDDSIDRSKRPAGTAAPEWRELGRRLVGAKGCANCHAVESGGKPPPTAATAPTLAAVRKAGPDRGCLAPKPDPAKVPVYALEARHREGLAAFLRDGLTGAGAKAPGYAARVALKRFNCLNCHQRDGEGGIGGELADRMRLLDRAENAEDVQPPRLTQVGHKARTEWLKSVLTDGGRARPWMTLRMPQYGGHNVGFLAEALAHLDGTAPDADPKPPAFTPEKLEAGRTLAGKNGLGCISCHDISGVTGGGTRGPDLALTAKRVRYDWYVRWMHNPQRIAPGTRMPQNYIDGKALTPTVYGGDADRQIDALWAYLALGPGLRLPAGMEPPKGLIVSVKDRTEVLRTFLPDGAGTRAVAVGYPGGVSVAFDAGACRLSYAWEGNFLDASPVWNNRGGAPAKLLGPKFWQAPAGHPWAVTDGPKNPPDFAARATDPAYGYQLKNEEFYDYDPKTDPPTPQRLGTWLKPGQDHRRARHVHFDGYTLDAAGNPAFRYRLDGPDGKPVLVVTETPGPLTSGLATGLVRRFAAELPAGKTAWLLAGVSVREPRVHGPDGVRRSLDLKAAEPEVPAAGSRVVLPQDGDRAVVLHLTSAPAGAAWRFVKGGAGWQAVLRLSGAKAEVTLATWALPRDDEGLLKSLGSGK